MAARAVLWSFDTAVQDKSGAIILDQGIYYKRAIEAVKYLKDLYEKALTPEVFAWNAAPNNQALITGRSSFILNSISAYRSAQDARPDIAKGICFTPALRGPNGTRVVPQFAQANAPLAKAFIKHLVANYDRGAVDWTTKIDYPGYANPAIGEVFNTFVIPNRVATVARDQDKPETAVKRAAAQAHAIFAKWRARPR